MTPMWFDHVLAIALVAIIPFEGGLMIRRLTAALARGDRSARLREYGITVVVEWVLVAVLLAAWSGAGRGLAALGLTLGELTGALAGVIITGIALGLLVLQWRAVRRVGAEGRSRLAAQFGSASSLLPRTAREAVGFRVLSVTAGICEEVLYRGYLIWYFGAWVGPGAAVLTAALGFGLAHGYQGRAGVLKTGLLGGLMGGLYVGTGSLVWPVILHVAIDLQGGSIGRWVMGDEPEATR